MIETRTIDEKHVKFQVWDTQQRFRTITTSYYRGCHAVFILFDPTNRESFNNVSSVWLHDCELHAPHAHVAIVCCKVDTPDFFNFEDPWTREREILYEHRNPNNQNIWGEVPTEIVFKILSLVPGFWAGRRSSREDEPLSLKDIEDFCNKIQRPLYFTSSLSGVGVEEVFVGTAKRVLENLHRYL